ncbi:MAG: type 4a pilus biogenesis protein PilO [Deltaproteobacteria bacterium]|nr:type 4a pilus biogenesis protein PilO [Deltaproteobacteria bacterium]
MASPKKNAAGPSLVEQFTPPVMIGSAVGIAAAVGVLYYFVGYLPMQDQFKLQNSRQNDLETQQATANRDLRAYNDDVAELERLRSFAREQQRVLPDNPDIPGFLRAINDLASDNQLNIRLIVPEEQSTEQYYARIPVRVDVNGSFLALARFYRSIAALPRVINMENISLTTPVVSETNDVRVDARMLATTFRALTAAEQQAAHDAPPAAPGAPPATRGRGGAR